MYYEGGLVHLLQFHLTNAPGRIHTRLYAPRSSTFIFLSDRHLSPLGGFMTNGINAIFTTFDHTVPTLSLQVGQPLIANIKCLSVAKIAPWLPIRAQVF